MEFKFNWVQIQLKGNEIQIGTKDIKNLLVTMMLKRKTLKKLRSKKHVFIPLYLGIQEIYFSLRNVQRITYEI